jgi:hypothetical protein
MKMLEKIRRKAHVVEWMFRLALDVIGAVLLLFVAWLIWRAL